MGFRGGYRFTRFEGQAQADLHVLHIPSHVELRLDSGLYDGLEPVVTEGDQVHAGSPVLKKPDSPGSTVVAPIGGKVRAIGDGSLVIDSDGTEALEPVPGHIREPWNLDHAELLRLVHGTGCWLLLDLPLPDAAACADIRHIVVGAVHNGPLDQAWSPGVFGDNNLFHKGLRTLRALFPDAAASIAVNRRNRRYFEISEITGHADVVTLADKYPQEHPELFVRDTAGDRLVSPEGVRDTGIVVLPFEHVIQLAEALVQGRPLVDRFLMAAGPGISRPSWYRARIGTPYDDIRRQLCKSDGHDAWRMVNGGLLDGDGLDPMREVLGPRDTAVQVIREYPVRELWRFMMPGFTMDSYSKSTAAEWIPILPKRLDTNMHGGVRPCIQCNYCDEVCPVSIYPHLIWKHVQADKTEESFRFRPFDCIGCGLCDYVCPSKIAISESVVRARDAYRESGRSDEATD